MRWYKVKNIDITETSSKLPPELNGYILHSTCASPDLMYSLIIAPDTENIPTSTDIVELTEQEAKLLGEQWQPQRTITYPDGSQEIIPKLDVVAKFKGFVWQ